MSYEAWGDNDDTDYDHLLEAGWWDDQKADAVKEAAAALFAERIYEDGKKDRGVSVQFIMRMTLLKEAVGDLASDDPIIVEAREYFAARAALKQD